MESFNTSKIEASSEKVLSLNELRDMKKSIEEKLKNPNLTNTEKEILNRKLVLIKIDIVEAEMRAEYKEEELLAA